MSSGTAGRPPRLPDGWVVGLDRGLRRRDGGQLLFGGSPPRVVRLRPAAVELLAGLPPDGRFVVDGPARASLARLLTDRGLAHPRPPESPPLPGTPVAADVTVVVPVRDRTDGVRRLLEALDPALRVVVVDDGSAIPVTPLQLAPNALDPGSCAGLSRSEPVEAHTARPALTVLRHARSRGPAAARNTGLRAVATPLVAFLDSDVVPRSGWIEAVLPQLADPAVGLVAPRIVALDHEADSPRRTVAAAVGAYERARSSLDLGADEALVVPHGRVSYVPSAALVARVAALGTAAASGTSAGAGFDESMPVAEDVDLVWRLHAAGWRCRYVPAAEVAHEHRTAVPAWLARKAYYGTGAAPLARRHPGNVAPVVLPGWAALVVALVLAQRRWSLAAAVAVSGTAAVRLAKDLPGRRSAPLAVELVGRSLAGTAVQTAGALNRHWWPAAALVAVRSRRMRRALVVAGVAEALLDRHRHPGALGPVGHLLAHRLDDWAYGAGLWWGAVAHRTPGALWPAIGTRHRPAGTSPARGAPTSSSARTPWNTGARPAPPPGAVAS